MDAHFRAYSFVDRITGLDPGTRIRGQYAVPASVDEFPGSLVCEATGQLAAWAAMAAVNFTHRPVAGIGGRIELNAEVRPGQVLELSAALESVDTETVGYGGTAFAEGTLIARLQDCVGPMVPVEEFDDPQALRERFALLRAEGARPGTFAGLPRLDLEPVGPGGDEVASAMLQVPTEAPFFGDHFPRRPVFPGTLLMHANLQTAARLAAQTPAPGGAGWVARIISDVKLRTFIAPGERIRLQAKRTGHSGTALTMSLESRINGRLIGSAEVVFAPRGAR